MPDWKLSNGSAATTPTLASLQEELRASQENSLLLLESLVDLELAAEDRGWQRLGSQLSDEFSPQGRKRLREVCRMLAVSHPLIKRAITVRAGYIWGQGVQVAARAADDADGGQDVNAVVQQVLDDNVGSLSGSQAQEELERALGTDGEVYLAAFTHRVTGRVRVRSTPVDEITDIITNPEDRDQPWFYVRQYAATKLEAGFRSGNTRTRAQTVKKVHPALGFRPATRPSRVDDAEVLWDAPILHVPVNRLDGWKHGIPDVYAAAAWARMYRDFLVDWAQLTKSLAKFAWRAAGDNRSRAAKAAATARAAATTPAAEGGVGQLAATGPGITLEAIPKSGAHIDAESGKPLAGMVAAGVGLPITMLLADPGVTGARATAETLDLPTILEMGMRRLLWQEKLTQLLNYAVEQAVIAPRGPLRGSLARDEWGDLVVTLAGDDGSAKTLDWDWPPLTDVDPVELVKAIVAADGTDVVPKPMVARLLLNALGVKDVDEIIAAYTDEQGRWVDPEITAGQAAVDAFRRGEDTAGTLR